MIPVIHAHLTPPAWVDLTTALDPTVISRGTLSATRISGGVVLRAYALEVAERGTITSPRRIGKLPAEWSTGLIGSGAIGRSGITSLPVQIARDGTIYLMSGYADHNMDGIVTMY